MITASRWQNICICYTMGFQLTVSYSIRVSCTLKFNEVFLVTIIRIRQDGLHHPSYSATPTSSQELLSGFKWLKLLGLLPCPLRGYPTAYLSLTTLCCSLWKQAIFATQDQQLETTPVTRNCDAMLKSEKSEVLCNKKGNYANMVYCNAM